MKRLLQFLSLLLAVTYIFSAYTKWVSPGFFEIVLIKQGLVDSRIAAAILTRFIIIVELALGLLIATPYYKKIILNFSFTLLSLFTLHLIYLWVLGDTENCGCFGEMISMSPKESILKNIALLVLNGIIIKLNKNNNANKRVLYLISLFSLGTVLVSIPISLSKSNLFEEFTFFENEGIVDLTEGKRYIAIFNTECEHCQETATQLTELKAKTQNFPTIFVLFYSEGITKPEEFNSITGSNFPYAMIDVNTFFDLIGNSPPRVYYMVNGEVQDIWDENIVEQLEKKIKR